MKRRCAGATTARRFAGRTRARRLADLDLPLRDGRRGPAEQRSLDAEEVIVDEYAAR